MSTLKRTNSDNPDFHTLTTALDVELCKIYGTKQEDYVEYNRIVDLPTVVLAYDGETPVACGCIKIFNDNTVEIKRMFVTDHLRGNGIASSIVKELETWANELGYSFSVLETGKGQPDAIGLYQKLGYKITANYGQYDGLENSVCMKKEL